jgi:hypothetical protein
MGFFTALFLGDAVVLVVKARALAVPCGLPVRSLI